MGHERYRIETRIGVKKSGKNGECTPLLMTCAIRAARNGVDTVRGNAVRGKTTVHGSPTVPIGKVAS